MNNQFQLPTILVDVDGVLADFVGGVLREIGISSRYESIHDLDLSKCLSKLQYECMQEMCHLPGFCTSLEWYPSAKNFVGLLNKIGYCYALTTPWECSTWCAERVDWLNPYIKKEKVIFAHAKHLVRGDILIEDNPYNVMAWKNLNPDKLAILLNRPWNVNTLVGYGIRRVEDLDAAWMLIGDSL